MNEPSPENQRAFLTDQGPRRRYPFSQRLVLATLAPLIAAYIKGFNAATLKNDAARGDRGTDVDEVKARLRGPGEPTIVAFWHNRMMMAPVAYQYCQGRGAVVMVSLSFDGDLLTSILSRFSFLSTARGSSSSPQTGYKAGKHALADMVEHGRQGRDLVITPDGPNGPIYQVKRGIIDLARHTGLPIYPVGCAPSRSFRLKGWDRTFVPLPGSRVVFKVGPPITVPPDRDEDLIEQKRRELERSMIELTDFTDRYY